MSIIKKIKLNKANIVFICLNLVDAFVALGGNLDKTGFVSKSTLINTLKN
jgi:hypothetical protein